MENNDIITKAINEYMELMKRNHNNLAAVVAEISHFLYRECEDGNDEQVELLSWEKNFAQAAIVSEYKEKHGYYHDNEKYTWEKYPEDDIEDV